MRLPLFAILFSVFGLGVFLPWVRGLDYLDPHLLFAVDQIPLAFTGRLTVAFSTSRSLLWAGVLGGLCAHAVGVLVLANGLLTVNILNWLGRVYTPPSYFLIALWALSLSSTLFSALGAAWLLSRGATTERTVLATRILFFTAMFGTIFLDRALNPDPISDLVLAQLGVAASCFALGASLLLVRSLSRKARLSAS